MLFSRSALFCIQAAAQTTSGYVQSSLYEVFGSVNVCFCMTLYGQTITRRHCAHIWLAPLVTAAYCVPVPRRRTWRGATAPRWPPSTDGARLPFPWPRLALASRFPRPNVTDGPVVRCFLFRFRFGFGRDGEKTSFTLSSNTCASGQTCGHYTQVRRLSLVASPSVSLPAARFLVGSCLFTRAVCCLLAAGRWCGPAPRVSAAQRRHPRARSGGESCAPRHLPSHVSPPSLLDLAPLLTAPCLVPRPLRCARAATPSTSATSRPEETTSDR